MNAATALADAIRAALPPLADPERAPGQQAYMRSAMPFLGVRVPDVRRAAAALARPVRDPDVLVAAASSLWEAATHREHRYAALALAGHRRLRGDPRLFDVAERWIREGAWWDITDDLAHRLGEQLDVDPDGAAARLRSWSRDEDLWIRRASIIAQLGRRENVDRSLLADAIEANAGDADLLIRKAIGWALRDHARVDPAWVRSFLDTRALSPLSVREARKHLG